ncbi:MAG TPA: hypothetical protein VFP72_23435 [Kineosporiaceae bacterium]|nr:hypothetical protein [Kineosporiaceae bacterium]
MDLCSGGSGPWTYLHADLAAAGTPVSVVFTDRFPDHAALPEAASAIDPDRARYEPDPVHAPAVPAAFFPTRT